MIVSRRWTSKYRRVGMAVLARGLSTDWLPSRKRHVEKFSLMPLFARSRVDFGSEPYNPAPRNPRMICLPRAASSV